MQQQLLAHGSALNYRRIMRCLKEVNLSPETAESPLYWENPIVLCHTLSFWGFGRCLVGYNSECIYGRRWSEQNLSGVR